MTPRNQRLATAAAMAAGGYLSAITIGAGAAFGVMMGIGIVGEIWLWGELIRRWRNGGPGDVPTTRP